jgi:hypothetical protein
MGTLLMHIALQVKFPLQQNIFYVLLICNSLNPVWSWRSPIECLPRWRIGKCSATVYMEGIGEIKYSGQTKTAAAAPQLSENYRG